MWKRLKYWVGMARTAWLLRRADSEETMQAARRALSMQMADARGLPMKIGQVLAGMDDDSDFVELISSVEPWPLEKIIPVLETAWGCPIHDVLSDIEESTAAASLGQVHQAHLRDGQTVAIKVQYPDIAHAIAAEMRLTGLMPGLGPVKRWQFDLDAYRQTLADNMAHELDYGHEMRAQQAFTAGVSVPGLTVPTVFKTWCRPNVLMQTWCEGERLAAAATWPLTERLYLARTLMMTLFQSVFVHGVAHGDPHPGNLMVRHDNNSVELTLLDFGCTISIEQDRRLALLKLILSGRGACTVNTVDAYAALGFDRDKLDFIAERLPQLNRLLFKPLLEDHPLDVKQWHPGQEAADLLGEERWWFRSAGPADLFLLMRIFQGLTAQLSVLDVKLPWWPMLTLAVPETIRQQAMAWQPVHQADNNTHHNVLQAHSLKVEIIRAGEQDIRMAMPASEACHLDELIPQESRQLLQQRGVKLADLQEEVMAQGITPRDLFSLDDGKTRYHVWLE
ncbi:MAG: AarF/ABC1/UbiB kinase family protein [Mariprofundaceae bacterium]|nr:AarF/ABC1/UbiB kinase family protein [Mariprofundaceae bacterium]